MSVRFLLASLIVVLSSSFARGQRDMQPVPGQLAPDVHAGALMRAPGWMQPGEIEMAELRGKVVYVKFWSTGCLPCIQAMPRHNDLKKKFGDKLVFLGVTTQTIEEVTGFIESHETSMIVLSDPENTTWQRYFAMGQGSGTLVCPDGRISRVSVEDLNLDEDMIEMALRNEYEDGPPIDLEGHILPQARAIGAEWGKPRDQQRDITGQDPFSLGRDASFQVICRPAGKLWKRTGGGSIDRFTSMAYRARALIGWMVPLPGHDWFSGQVPDHRIIGPEWLDERRFDFIYCMPGVDLLQRQRIVQAAIEAGMGVTIEHARRTLPGFRMVRAEEASLLPASEDAYTSWIGGKKLDDGRSAVRAGKQSFAHLCEALERFVGGPVDCQINDDGEYDFMIPGVYEYNKDEMSQYLEQRYGLRLIPDDVDVDVLVVRETGAAWSAVTTP